MGILTFFFKLWKQNSRSIENEGQQDGLVAFTKTLGEAIINQN